MKKKILLLFLGFLVMARFGFSQEPTITKGLFWLNTNQNPDGTWGNPDYAPLIDTCAVSDTFHYLGTANPKAIQWITEQPGENTDHLSRKILSLALAGSDTTALIGTLTLSQNEDGGWGIALGYESDCLDTLLSLFALKSANYSDTTIIESALWYLISNQNEDGGFGFDESNVYLTSLVLLTLNQYRREYYLEEAITKASDWLITQNPETLWEKALAYSAIADFGLQIADLEYILNNQQPNGSWDNDPFTTALCLRAIKDAAPDLIVSEILFDPQVPLEGETTTITAIIENIGGSISGTTTIAFSFQPEALSLKPLSPDSTSTITIIATFTSGTHKITAELDPNNLINEKNETNNTKTTNLTVRTLADLTGYITFSKDNPNVDEGVIIMANIMNIGETEAENIEIELLEDNHINQGIT
ncbi:MAG: CARDB domain-containing protein, partial [bacterium]